MTVSSAQAFSLRAPEDWEARGFGLRLEADDDGEFLRDLFASVRGPDFAMAGWPPEMLAPFLATQFQFQARHYAGAYPDAARYVLTHRGEPMGRLFLHVGSDAIRVVDVALLPQFRGGGLGASLLRAVQAAADGFAITLSVNVGSAAHRLYQRLGFAEIAGNEVAWEMCWTRT